MCLPTRPAPPASRSGCASSGAMKARAGMVMPPSPPPMLTLSLPSVARAAGPDLLAVDRPPTVGPGRPGPDAGRVGAGARLAEQLAPDDVLVERRADPARHLVWGGVLDQGEDDPAGDAVTGPLDPGRGELLLDHQLLDGARVPAPRLGPVRHRVAGFDHRLLPRVP